eukprot:6119988-Pyramimonas_sp.AAC.1
MAKVFFALIPCLVGGVLLWRRPPVEGAILQLLSVPEYIGSHLEEGYLPAESTGAAGIPEVPATPADDN